ncbi:MAG TPA: caspase family protein [Blastocatellia bacterium]|nr:caspase family protein [Blastocatellia bacterium]
MARWILSLLLLFCLSSLSTPAQERCSTANDYLVAARQLCRPGASKSDLESALNYLKFATKNCYNLADAWYYRYLCETRLGDQRAANNSFSKAKELGSEALSRGDDPFTLSTASTAPADKPVTTDAGSAVVRARVRDKWALVIGISKFRDSRINLEFTSKDARDFFSYLIDKDYGRFKASNVHLLVDDQATTVHIKSELEWLRLNAKQDDLVVIYVSTHGSPGSVDPEGISYVITYDTEVAEDRLYATSLPMVDIVSAVQNRIRAQRAAVFLDTCYSGAALKGAKGLGIERSGVSNTTLDRFREGTGRVVISASQANERSWESDKLKNGYFTHYLIRGLKQKNGLVSIEQVYAYVKEEVSKSVRQELKQSQTPSMKKSDNSMDVYVGVDTAIRQ